MYQHEIHIHNLQYLRNEKNRKVIMLTVSSEYTIRFFLFRVKSIDINSRVQQKTGFCPILGKTFARHCHFSLTEVTVIRKCE